VGLGAERSGRHCEQEGGCGGLNAHRRGVQARAIVDIRIGEGETAVLE